MGREEDKKQSPNEIKKKKSPEKDLNEIEVSNALNTEFRVMVIRMLKIFTEEYIKLNGNYKKINGNYISIKK